MNLSDSRPALRGPLWCVVCNKRVEEWMESGLHCAGFTMPGFEHLKKDNKPDRLLSGEGLTLIQAMCHGETCSVAIPFSVIREMKLDDKVELFGDRLLIGGVEPVIPEELTTFYDPETGKRCDLMGNPLPEVLPDAQEPRRLKLP